MGESAQFVSTMAHKNNVTAAIIKKKIVLSGWLDSVCKYAEID